MSDPTPSTDRSQCPSSLNDESLLDISTISSRSSSRIENDSAEVGLNGVLDLSNQGISGLSRRFTEEYAKTRKLILSHNSFHQISKMEIFHECTEILADNNLLSKLSSFLPLSRQLLNLDVSHNRLTIPEHMVSFSKLQYANLSANLIESLPLLKTAALRCLDLSFNNLSQLPDLSRVPNLEILNLADNQLTSLEEVNRKLPTGLKELNICNNVIDDLCQFLYLTILSSLQCLSIAGNPCVKESYGVFNYRPYLFCVVCGEFGGSLNEIDGFILTDEEKLKGEWLLVQGKGRRFRPGSHHELSQYLTKECPFENTKQLTKHEANLQKVLEKRREYLSQSGGEEALSRSPSLHSPYSNWNSRFEGKENLAPSTSTPESTRCSRHRSRFLAASPITPRHPLSRSDTMESVESNSTVVLSTATAISVPASDRTTPTKSTQPTIPESTPPTNVETTPPNKTEAVQPTRTRRARSRPSRVAASLGNQSTSTTVPVPDQDQTNPTSFNPNITTRKITPRRVKEFILPDSSDVSFQSQSTQLSFNRSNRDEKAEEDRKQNDLEAASDNAVNVTETPFVELETTTTGDPMNSTFVCAKKRNQRSRSSEERRRGTQTISFGPRIPESPTSPSKFIPDCSSAATTPLEEFLSEQASKVSSLESIVHELAVQNENLTQINDTLSKTLVEMQARFEREIATVHADISRCASAQRVRTPVPVPQSIISTQVEGGNVFLQWQLPVVKGYHVYLDGEPLGEVRGLRREATVTDLSPGKHVIQLSAISHDGREGEKSAMAHVDISKPNKSAQSEP